MTHLEHAVAEGVAMGQISGLRGGLRCGGCNTPRKELVLMKKEMHPPKCVNGFGGISWAGLLSGAESS